MQTSSIGVQTITPTTGTTAQDSAAAQDRASDNESSNANSARVNPTPSPGTGTLVDKRV